MDPNRFDRLREIVVRAARIGGREREAYLESACDGNADLRREAESLLAREASAAGRIEDLAGRVSDSLRAEAPLPERIGAYRITGVLGEGGMGVVYRAEQDEPIRRQVALKLVRHGLDSAGVRARLDVERRTLARLEHPNIATVLDAGADDSGRPYFVMELVRGLSITDYCRSAKLGARERVRLFLDVARAIGHAHRHGVIHRDLKPSNVLVSEVQGRPLAKVIDFGIAKVLAEPELATVFRTRTGQLVGTLEYMSPEQARGELAAIDTRSDVWALGVILFELLADRLPLDLGDLPLHEAVQRIALEPPRSLRRGSTGASTRVDADLETIVGKCMEKEPERRYGSAGELVEDLERYLDSRPILARPPTASYQIRKLIGRHRVATAFLVTVFVFLLAFGVTMTVLFRQQRAERLLAEAEARRGRAAQRVSQLIVFDLANKVPDEHRGPLEEALRRVLVEVEGLELMNEPEERAAVFATLAGTYSGFQMQEESRRFMRRSLVEQCEVFRRRYPQNASSWNALEALIRLEPSPSAGAVPLADLARSGDRHLRQDLKSLADSLFELAADHYAVGQHEAAVLLATELKALAVALFDEGNYLVDSSRSMLASSLGKLRRFDEAEAIVRETIEFWHRREGDDAEHLEHAELILGTILYGASRFAEAEPVLRSAVERCIRGESVNIPTAQHYLGLVLQAVGRYAEAEEFHRSAVRWRRDQGFGTSHHTALALGGLGHALAAQGRLDEAREPYARALEISEEIFGPEHPETVVDRTELGVLSMARGAPNEAEQHLRRAFEFRENLAGERVLDGAKLDLAFGWLLLRKGEAAGAEPLLRRGFETRRDLLPEGDPRTGVAGVLLGAALGKLGRMSEARALVNEHAHGLGPPAHPLWVDGALAVAALDGA